MHHIPTLTRKPNLDELFFLINQDRGKYILIGTRDNNITVWYGSPNHTEKDICVQHTQSYTQYFATSHTVADVIAYVINIYNVPDNLYIGDL